MITDEKILEKINKKLVEHTQIEAGNIWINIEEGIVFLAGSVPDEKTKELVEKIVQNIQGVNGVENLLSTKESEEIKPLINETSSPKQKETDELKLQRGAMTSEGGHDTKYIPPTDG